MSAADYYSSYSGIDGGGGGGWTDASGAGMFGADGAWNFLRVSEVAAGLIAGGNGGAQGKLTLSELFIGQHATDASPWDIVIALLSIEKNPIIGAVVSGLVNSMTWAFSISIVSSDSLTVSDSAQTVTDKNAKGGPAVMTSISIDYIYEHSGLYAPSTLPEKERYMLALEGILAHEIGHAYEDVVMGPIDQDRSKRDSERVANFFEQMVNPVGLANSMRRNPYVTIVTGPFQPLSNPF
jgi:hypothetical protein